MADEVTNDQENGTLPSPSNFLRERRPELFSDTRSNSKKVLQREVLSNELDYITAQKREYDFETFGRKLMQKTICPNLLPQSGPTGGGDSKVDSETYPVSEDISERWYEGDARVNSVSERWAVAISAKKDWRTKLKSDLSKT